MDASFIPAPGKVITARPTKIIKENELKIGNSVITYPLSLQRWPLTLMHICGGVMQADIVAYRISRGFIPSKAEVRKRLQNVLNREIPCM